MCKLILKSKKIKNLSLLLKVCNFFLKLLISLYFCIHNPIIYEINCIYLLFTETLETEIDKLESADPNSRQILSCSGVVQAVKAICALLGSIDTLEISACIADLKRICEEGQVKYASHSTVTNPEIVSERGDYAEVRLVPRPMLDQIKLKCNQLRDAVQELIELYSNVFRVGFSVKSMDYSTSKYKKNILVCRNFLIYLALYFYSTHAHFVRTETDCRKRKLFASSAARLALRRLLARRTNQLWHTLHIRSYCHEVFE